MKRKQLQILSFILIGALIMSVTGACGPSHTDSQFTNISYPSSHGQKDAREDITVLNKMTLAEQMTMYWKFFFEKGEKVPRSTLPQKEVELSKIYNSQDRGIRSVWLGHSTMLINIDGCTVLTDPVFEKKVSPIGPTRFNRQLPLQPEDLPFVDIVIISHDHYDHLNKYSIQSLAEKTDCFIVPLGVGKKLIQWSIPKTKIVELNWWESYRFSDRLAITATPAQHFSGRGLFDRNQTLWASWVISSENTRIFFSGDSGYFPGFKEIGERFGPFDVTFLECGAYNEHWSNVHMFPEQTVQAFLDLRGAILQPIHWATFNLSLHSWYEPVERLSKEALNRNVPLSLPMIGEVIDYDRSLVSFPWWKGAMEKTASLAPQSNLVANVQR